MKRIHWHRLRRPNPSPLTQQYQSAIVGRRFADLSWDPYEGWCAEVIKYDPLRNALDYSGSEMMYTQHRGVARRWAERRLRGIARRTP